MHILVLGGYGQFGGRISRTLAGDGDLDVLVAGRDAGRATRFIGDSGSAAARMSPLQLDTGDAAFADGLAAARPDLVIHTAGPFQGSDYTVARAALACGAHYIDLADGRRFVTGFDALDADARRAGRWAISGASSVPGLSAAVIDAHLTQFSRLDAIDSGISPGNRTPRGLATTQAILGYVGKPMPVLLDGRWRDAHGWQSLRRERYGDAGTRWLARCDVPDLALLPTRYPSLRSCEFRAGLELRRMHFGLWLASWAVRAGVLRNLPAWAGTLLRISEHWLDSGSQTGVMHVDMRGLDTAGVPLSLRWTLWLRDGDGPQVPCTAAIVLARKLAHGQLPGAGARACVDFFTLADYLDALRGFSIETSTVAYD